MKSDARHELTTPGSVPSASMIRAALRLGVFMCFLGHGSYAILAKPEWATFFGVVGIPGDAGLRLLPWVGLLDLTVASFAIASPRPVVFLWAAVWCLWTAALRPLSGLGMWEFWVRAGNFGVPIAFLALHPWPRSAREWVRPLLPGLIAPDRLRVAGFILRAAVVLSLLGHAGLGLFQRKEGLLSLYEKAGLPAEIGGVAFANAVGWFEVALAAVLLLKPLRGHLVFLCLFRIALGILGPATGAYWWDFIEHGADYTAPVALALVAAALDRARTRAHGFAGLPAPASTLRNLKR